MKSGGTGCSGENNIISSFAVMGEDLGCISTCVWGTEGFCTL